MTAAELEVQVIQPAVCISSARGVLGEILANAILAEAPRGAILVGGAGRREDIRRGSAHHRAFPAQAFSVIVRRHRP